MSIVVELRMGESGLGKLVFSLLPKPALKIITKMFIGVLG